MAYDGYFVNYSGRLMTSLHTYIFSNAYFEHYLLAAILKITLMSDDRSRNSTECTTFSVTILGIERHLLLLSQLEMNGNFFSHIP